MQKKGCVGQGPTPQCCSHIPEWVHKCLWNPVEVSALFCSSAPLPDSGNGDAEFHYPYQMLWGLWLKHCAVKILLPDPALLCSLKTPGETQLLGRLRLQEACGISAFSSRAPQGCL